MAGYMTITNQTHSTQQLVGVQAEGFGMVMIHQSLHENGTMKMHHIEALEIPQGGEAVLAPGGYHLMLMQPKEVLKEGDLVRIKLEFADGSNQSVDFAVNASDK